jgi:hypothetical protein
MNTASIDRLNGAVVPFAAARLLRGWAPLHAWNGRRRRAVAGVIAAVACAVATSIGMTTDFAGTAGADARLAAARRELEEARRALDVLPALKRAAALEVPQGQRRTGNSADDARDVAELAASAGVVLVSLEPGASAAKDAQRTEALRTLKLTAQGGFAQLRAFLHGLARAPALMVPVEATIRRNGAQLSLAATLSVFDALPSLPATATTDDAGTPPDPFATNRIDSAPTGDSLRFAGLIQDRTHALALIETPRGTDAVERGSRIEGESVARIGLREVTLTAGSTTRVLKWTEDGR